MILEVEDSDCNREKKRNNYKKQIIIAVKYLKFYINKI